MCEKLEQATCPRRGTSRRDKEEYKEKGRAGKGEKGTKTNNDTKRENEGENKKETR